MYEIRWHGRGGQGSFTIAKILGIAASIYEDKYAQAFPSFGPERRGAPVLGFTRIDENKITDRSEIETCDFVVVLDETLWGENVLKGLKEDSVILINTDNLDKYKTQTSNKVVAINATKLALEILNLPITNTAMLGALAGYSKIVKKESCINAIKDTLNPKIAEKNITLFEKAYSLMEEVNHE